MYIGKYALHLNASSVCVNCVCFYCHNVDCPHLTRDSVRVSQWKTHRCYKCGVWWQNKRPLEFCDFFISVQRPRTKLYTIIRRYRKKTEMQILAERLSSIEKILEKLYNRKDDGE